VIEKNSSLIISASGVRGIVGEGLVPEIVVGLAAAFGEIRKGKILVGYDTRTSNEMFKYAVISALLSTGCEVIDLGMCPTPSVQLMVRKSGANGGVVITGSHNPAEWNALKFVRSDGLFLFPEEGEELVKVYRERRIKWSRWNGIGKVYRDDTAVEYHIDRIMELVDVDKIKGKNFKVVIDACNGAGSVISPVLLERLGCKTFKINCNTSGYFPHLPEPIPDNLQQLCRAVKDYEADIGFAHDIDADRLALVVEGGRAISEEYTLALVTKFVLQKSPGLVVTNVCTSQMIDDIAEQFNCPVKRTRVGDIYVSRCMMDCGAVIGGEGNGGVIFPLINYARDGVMALALLLNYMAEEKEPISSIVDKLPRYYRFKNKVKSYKVNLDKLREDLLKKFSSNRVDFTDGVKIWFNEGWIHMRKSGTEPVVRIIGEAKDPEDAEKLSNWALNFIDEFSY